MSMTLAPPVSTRIFRPLDSADLLADHGHSLGIVVLVALCAALGTIFLLILLGIILNRIQRRRAGYRTVPGVPTDKNSNIRRVPPDALFGNLGAKEPGAPTI
jgi:hypothetical protein